MWIVGLLLAVGFVVAHIFFWLAAGSVWCFMAAIISMFMYLLIVQENRKQRRRAAQ
jgi:hypothetical protein